MDNFKNILVLGLGITGKSVYDFLYKKGFNVYITDDNIQNFEEIKDKYQIIYDISKIDFSSIDCIVVSPSIQTINNPHLIVLNAKQNNIPILTDLDILQYYYKAKYIGITGTNGKSTTVSMLYNILTTNGLSVYLCGNIGNPMLNIDKDYDYIIIELSSYQIENANKLNIDFSAILNISPSHLDHHGTFESYKNAKLRLLNSQYCLINENLGQNNDIFSTSQILENSISIVNNNIYYYSKNIANINDFANNNMVYYTENLCVAIGLALKIGLSIEQIISGLKTYKPLAHRAEIVRKIGYILFINDSKATNIASVIKPISENKNIILIMGGKMLTNYDDIDKFLELKNNIKKIFLIGESKDFLHKILTENNIDNKISNTLDIAVKEAYKHTISLTKNNKSTDFIIMLCPMHPSIDQFKNFETRGDLFKNLVNSLY